MNKALLSLTCAICAVTASQAIVSPRSYIQDGLIAHWDAEYNAGYDAPHAVSPTSWVELTGKGPSIPVPSGATFTDKGIVVTRTQGSLISSGAADMLAAVAARKYTAEIAYDKTAEPSGGQYSGLVKMLLLGREGYFMGLTGSNSAGFQTIGQYWEAGIARVVSLKPNNSGKHTFSCSQSESTIDIYGDVTNSFSTSITESARELTHGIRFNRSYYSNVGLDGAYHSIRFYDRKLTRDEIKVNAAVDKVRFFGIAPGECDLPNGWRFTGTAPDVALEKQVYANISLPGAGQITVNGGTAGEQVSYWAEVNEPYAISLTAVANTGYEFARWNGVLEDKDATNPTGTFTAIGPIVAVFRKTGSHRLSSLSYIQDGLIAQWDGEENVGRGSYMASTSEWKSLVGDLSIAVPGNAAFTGNGIRTVRANGSMVSGSDLDAMTETVVNTHYSVEIAFNKTAATTKSTTGSKNYMCNMFVLRYNKFPVGTQTEEGVAERMGFSPNGSNGGVASEKDIVVRVSPSTTMGHHTFFCSHSGSAVVVRADGSLSYTASISPTDFPLQNNHYFWFNRSWYEDTGLDGVYYAIRYYNRALTEDEVKVNQAVDQVRFFGFDPLTTPLPEGYRFSTADGIQLEKELPVSVNDAAMGLVSVNGAEAVAETTYWSDCSAETTLSLVAVPAEDYRFSRWEGVVTGDIHASSGTFGVRGNVRAVFKKISGLMLTVR